MFANATPPLSIVNLPAPNSQRPALGLANWSQFETIDAEDQLAWTEAADTHLLRLVMCAAFATLTLALVSSLA